MRQRIVRSAFFLIALASFVLATELAYALTSPFTNIDQIAQNLNVGAYGSIRPNGRTIKIAILDNGFRGYAAEIGKSLPTNTTYHSGPIAVDPNTEEAHGLFMAQLISGILSRVGGGSVPYELHLFSAFGYSNLKAAVQAVTQDRFDVVLYSQVWEYGGFGDTRGFINALVTQGLANGTVWINAAGTFGDATYRAPVERIADDWAWLPGPNQSVQVRCYRNSTGKCKLRAVLSWNDFKDDVAQGTDKDLDLVLSDDMLKIVRTSGLQQKKEFPEGTPGVSLYPREIIEAEITPGLYLLRVKIRSQNFSKSVDELRIVTSGDYIEQFTRNSEEETLLPPADNPGVITIGANDTEKSARSQKLGKPELLFPSQVTLANGESYKGSSNSAAIAAAAVAILKAINPELDRSRVLALLSGNVASGGGISGGGVSSGGVGQGLPLNVLQFLPTGPACFETAILPFLPQPALPFLRGGAVTVRTSAGLKIFTNFDPFTQVSGVSRSRMDDMLIVTAQGFAVYPRSAQWQLGQNAWEVVQTPRDQVICEFARIGRIGPVVQPAPASAQPAPLPRKGPAPVMRLPHPNQI